MERSTLNMKGIIDKKALGHFFKYEGNNRQETLRRTFFKKQEV